MWFLARNLLLVSILFLAILTAYLTHLRQDESTAYRIGFVSTRTGTREVYTMTAVGSDVRQLTQLNIGMFSYPRWDAEHHCLVGSQRLNNFCVNLDGEVYLEFTDLPAEPVSASSLGLDGGVSVVTDDEEWVIIGSKSGLYRSRLDGSDLVQLSATPTQQVDYIDQTSQILFRTEVGWSIISLNGTAEYFLTRYDIVNYITRVSPDGKWLVVQFRNPFEDETPTSSMLINPTGDYSIYIDTHAYSVFWTKDSHYLVYLEGQQAYTYDLIEKVRYPLTIVQSGVDQFFVYDEAPDGDWLIMQANQHIHVIRPDGSEAINLSDHPLTKHTTTSNNFTFPHMNRNADWSPDGAWIIFQSELQYGTSDIYRVRPDGTDLQRLTTDPNWDVEPSWLPPIEKAWNPEYLLGSGLGIFSGGMLILQIGKKRRGQVRAS